MIRRMLVIVALMCAIVCADEPSLLAHVDTAKQVKSVQLAGDFTVEWWQYIDSNSIQKAKEFASFGSLKAATKPLPKAKEKDPARAVFTVGGVDSKSQAYANKWYYLAAVRQGETLTLYVNGQ